MKTLKNQETSLPKNKDEKLSYFDLFKTVLESNGQEGFTIQQIRKRLRAVEALEGKQEAELEDDDFETLKACWDAMKWGIVSKNISEADTFLKEIK